MSQSTTQAFPRIAETFRDKLPLDEPVRSEFRFQNRALVNFGSLSLSNGSEVREPITGLEIFNRSLALNYLPLVTALENLIDVVGTSETRLFTSLTENHYERLVTILDGLIDVVGEDEDHILASLMDFIGTLIEHYEDEHVPELSEI